MVLPRFLTELKRRNVYRAALVYAAVGWLILEAADVVLPRLGLPDWTVNAVLAVVLLGFPLALVFAWIFDLNTQGIVRTEPLSLDAHHQISITSIFEFVVICVLVATVGYLYVERLALQKRLVESEPTVQEASGAGQPAVPNPEHYRAIAVLPFADMSEAGDQQWFAEGIAEELLIALSQVKQLYVMARTSSFAFKDTDKTIAEIAGILGVQDELAKSIVRALRVELGVESGGRLIAEQTANIEAYNLFIRGRALYDWANWETHFQSIQYLERAVEADPEYALAWGYLAGAQSLSVIWRSIDDVYAAARTAYERALMLDPGQSEALASKALMAIIQERDWKGAGKLYQQSLAPGDNTVAMIGFGAFLLPAIDRLEESLRIYMEAEERDPLHAGIKANLAIFLLYNGDAIASIQKARDAL
jgi:TolB-like protein